VREVAQVTGLTGPTAHRIIRALHRQGFLEQDPLTDTYHLGYGAALLGRLALERLGFTSARPILAELARETGETVSLGVRVHDESVVVIVIPSTHPLRIDTPAGTRNPAVRVRHGQGPARARRADGIGRGQAPGPGPELDHLGHRFDGRARAHP
jgi:DNA-binding IclR family transcriptional regulator